MTCQILLSGKNKKTIPKCRLLKFLPIMQSVKQELKQIHKLLISHPCFSLCILYCQCVNERDQNKCLCKQCRATLFAVWFLIFMPLPFSMGAGEGGGHIVSLLSVRTSI